jgi:hypothetical protein
MCLRNISRRAHVYLLQHPVSGLTTVMKILKLSALAPRSANSKSRWITGYTLHCSLLPTCWSDGTHHTWFFQVACIPERRSDADLQQFIWNYTPNGTAYQLHCYCHFTRKFTGVCSLIWFHSSVFYPLKYRIIIFSDYYGLSLPTNLFIVLCSYIYTYWSQQELWYIRLKTDNGSWWQHTSYIYSRVKVVKDSLVYWLNSSCDGD